jgi:hypothetical protein
MIRPSVVCPGFPASSRGATSWSDVKLSGQEKSKAMSIRDALGEGRTGGVPAGEGPVRPVAKISA